jgi:mannan endo-1,4-beta-mannosidase
MGGIAVPAETWRPGRHKKPPSRLRNLIRRHRAGPAAAEWHALDTARIAPQVRPDRRRESRRTLTRIVLIAAVVISVAAAALVGRLSNSPIGGKSGDAAAPSSAAAPAKSKAFLGVYTPGVPKSYAGIESFTAATGVRPGLVVYYSGWMEPFQAGFAQMAARHHATALVQIDPSGISLAAIASGQYDVYLRSYAAAVKAFGSQVILSFGHEMNGHWYSWAYRHSSPTAFVAAWRHIVTVFRQQGADNVTWLWTVNVIDSKRGILSPARWWPGNSYVTWVGIDGYYLKPSWTFASLFGPTIKAVRELTLAPILIAETAAVPATGKPAKIADLFAGVRAYGLLGFVWFDVNKNHRDWRLIDPAAAAAYRRGAQANREPAL